MHEIKNYKFSNTYDFFVAVGLIESDVNHTIPKSGITTIFNELKLGQKNFKLFFKTSYIYFDYQYCKQLGSRFCSKNN